MLDLLPILTFTSKIKHLDIIVCRAAKVVGD